MANSSSNSASWYPQDKKELIDLLNKLISNNKDNNLKINNIHGLMVPHAGYAYSGKIAGSAFGLLKDNKSWQESKLKKAIILGPSHYVAFSGVRAINKIKTPLGEVKIIKNNFQKLEYEHSVINQIPFLQKLNPRMEILPLVVGNLTSEDSKKYAEMINKMITKETILVISTDLSHFLDYNSAVKKDKETIKIIESFGSKNKLNPYELKDIDACGIFPLLILMQLCKINKWSPKLIQYKNSGDIIKDKSSVVGYASFYF